MSTVFSTQDKLLYEYENGLPLDFFPVISVGRPIHYSGGSSGSSSGNSYGGSGSGIYTPTPTPTTSSIAFFSSSSGTSSSVSGGGNSTTSSYGGGSATTTSTTTTTQQVSWGSFSREKLRDPDFWSVTFLYPCLYGILAEISVKIFTSVSSLNAHASD
jgi:hypothetical protein